MPTLDLAADDLATVCRLLAQHVPHAEVWAYGSRVTGHAHGGSDLDLVVRNPTDLTQPVSGVLDLRDALHDSDLPILVDVFDWARIPPSFREEVEQQHVALQAAGSLRKG